MTAYFVDARTRPCGQQFSVRAGAESHIVILDTFGERFDLNAMRFLVVSIHDAPVRPCSPDNSPCRAVSRPPARR